VYSLSPPWYAETHQQISVGDNDLNAFQFFFCQILSYLCNSLNQQVISISQLARDIKEKFIQKKVWMGWIENQLA
jgi:hypothetical protein